MSVRIPIHAGRGANRKVVGHALVDAQDAWLANYSWRLDKDGYARRSERTEDGKVIDVRMHREVIGLDRGDPLQSDHINRNKLDNRRSNLRAVTHEQNRQNVPGGHGRSGFRGVYFETRIQRWVGRVRIDKKSHYVGCFKTAEEAGAATSEFRRQHMPFAVEDVEAVA